MPRVAVTGHLCTISGRSVTAVSGRTIEGDTAMGPSSFRFSHLQPYEEAARTWLRGAGEMVDTTHLTAPDVAHHIAETVKV